MSATTPMLELQRIAKRLGGVQALSGVSFQVRAGTIAGLIGPNGAGKTTTLNVINGLVRPDSGSVLFESQPIAGLRPHAISRLGIGRMLQDPRVFAEMRVLDNVMLAFPGQAGENPLVALFGGARYRAEEARLRSEALELLELVGLAGRADELAGRLSYGQQRLLSLARCLATRARLLLLDEPTVGVNAEIVARIQDVLRDLVRRHGKTILLVEHNMDVVMSLSDKVIVLLGEVIAAGCPQDIQRDEQVLDLYLGTSVDKRSAISHQPSASG
ncbi:MAG: ABC transporter ATP-binding protein [Chloroflexi bacterium]|nr:ABC transporter ATP-binding protein [Chloroflexota bacterium]